jgi:hypothetical protein
MQALDSGCYLLASRSGWVTVAYDTIP